MGRSLYYQLPPPRQRAPTPTAQAGRSVADMRGNLFLPLLTHSYWWHFGQLAGASVLSLRLLLGLVTEQIHDVSKMPNNSAQGLVSNQ